MKILICMRFQTLTNHLEHDIYAGKFALNFESLFMLNTLFQVFKHQSWTSGQITSHDQHAELLKRLVKDDLKRNFHMENVTRLPRILIFPYNRFACACMCGLPFASW